MISVDIHILTDEDLENHKADAYNRGWEEGRKALRAEAKWLRRVTADNNSADPAAAALWLADINR